MVNEDAFLYQPASKGQNISLCGIISNNGWEHGKLIDGSYNRECFMGFLVECGQKDIFSNNPVIILDNVRFHHCEEIVFYLSSIGVEVMLLPAYSPDLNSIENVFGTIKSRLNAQDPRASTREQLKHNIETVINEVGELREYYRIFWERVNAISNRLL
ncbi:hypothetical protein CDIK_2494 [Cucumispora dikerogammari]|nr:hypothetical protein CDIK_2494 [Cucumispora dikerogammari]